MTSLTPEQEAAHALESGIARSGLSEKAKLAYDGLVEHARATAQAPAPAPVSSIDDKPPQAGAAGSSPASPPQLEVDNITGFSADPVAGPELGTVNENELWGAIDGELGE